MFHEIKQAIHVFKDMRVRKWWQFCCLDILNGKPQKKMIKNKTYAAMKERNPKEKQNKTRVRLMISKWLTLFSLNEPLLSVHRWGRQAECLTFPLFRHDACERKSAVASLSLQSRLNSNQKSQSHCTHDVAKQANHEIKEDPMINPPALIQHPHPILQSTQIKNKWL